MLCDDRYFKCYDDNEPHEESAEIFKFWHQKLVNYFEQGSHKDGQVEVGARLVLLVG